MCVGSVGSFISPVPGGDPISQKVQEALPDPVQKVVNAPTRLMAATVGKQNAELVSSPLQAVTGMKDEKQQQVIVGK